jgi:pimeloyl-ACP methyl ester carboxylesterase
MTDAAIRPFAIDVPDAVLADLRERLARTRFPDEVAGGGWTYGTDLAYLRDLVAYWRGSFDWRAAERTLNAMPQFMTQIEGRDLHFVHRRGKGPAPMPLLISHGWPGSFYEMAQVLGPLTDPAAHGGDPADAFDVVVPSLPGYGFSAAAQEGGMTTRRMGDVFATLMRERLGYRRFGVQGGDWGSAISAAMAFFHAPSVIGLHLNMLGVRPHVGEGAPPLTDEEKSFMARAQAWRNAEAGYQEIQGTRPQTLAYGLTDSPAGLAGWIVEKFRVWSDCGGDLERRFSKDRLLTNIMIYWVSGCIGSSIRLYYEQRHNPWRMGPGDRIEVPTAYAMFPGEPISPDAPRSWLERCANVQRWTRMPRGGHFAAMEEPSLLVEDIRAFFRPLRSAM